ncbi:MAG: hypothetical protein DMF76_20645 [Acidobacteria bacterium]|nr:MAG: hypothetical protein DMF76_20645 [Acidobacteriota bacterium]
MSRFVSAAGLVASVLVVMSVAQQRGTFTVGTATAARGHKATGTIEVPPGVDAGLSIPVAVFQGAKPGPVLALVAGAHGTEYTSIIALEKLIVTLNPAEISTEGAAPQPYRSQEHESLLSRQDRWHAD